MVTLLLWSMRAGSVFILQLDVLSRSMCAYWLTSAWRMGLCLIHLHPEEHHLVRNKTFVLRNHNFALQAHLFTVAAKSSKATRRCYLESRFSKWALRNPHHIHNCFQIIQVSWRTLENGGASSSGLWWFWGWRLDPRSMSRKIPLLPRSKLVKLPPLIDPQAQDADY